MFKGLNRFVWDMRWPGAVPLEGALLWGGGTEGPTAVPGWYTATFTLGVDTQTVRFEIRKDPRLSTSIEDFQAQFELHSKINTKLSEVHTAIKRLREVRSTLNGLSSRWKDLDTNATKDVTTLSKTITDSLTSIEGQLIQTKAKAFQDLLNYPVKLNNKIASLASVASSADRRPTQQTFDLFATLSAKADEYLVALRSIEVKEIADLNAKIKDLNLPAVPASSKDK